jgi:tripartite-type tricarboxylate transporter receptor subunit TctC
MFARIMIVIGALAALVHGGQALAKSDDFPSKPVRIVVPFAAGGGVDTLARLLADRLKEKFNSPVLVENRPGASGVVGGVHVQQSSADGYTLLFSTGTHAMANLVLKNTPYHPLGDFTPIARVAEAPLLAVLAPNLPQKTLEEVARAAASDPKTWTAATPSLGSPGHMATIQFNRLTKGNILIAPYRGTAPAVNDVSGGHVQFLIDAIVALLPMAEGGQLKALAITGPKRSKLAPHVPTAIEMGVPIEIMTWYGFWGPKGMPADIIKKLNAAFSDATLELAKGGRLAALGVDPVQETPEQFQHFAAAEVARNSELLRSVDFKPQ